MEQLLSDKNLEFLIDIGIALMCGLLIGGERELKKKPAGVSTQTLVIGASMIFTFMSQAAASGDKTRIAAQIVSGIGFLGAGLIIRSNKSDQLKNVTTAASIWYSASIGMAIGFGFYFMAVVGALYAVLISRIPRIKD